MHLLSQPVNFSPGIEEDDSLSDGQCFIQITQGVQLPLLETVQATVSITSTFLNVKKVDVTQDLEAKGTGH